MSGTDGFQGASDSIFDEASYVIDDVEYKQNAKEFAVTDYSHQIVMHPLLGKHQVDITLIRLNNGNAKPIHGPSDDHVSWFQTVIAPRPRISFHLYAASNGSSSGPRSTLEVGTDNYYSGSPSASIMYETLTVNAIPTTITLMNYDNSTSSYCRGLSSLEIHGSANNKAFKKWIRCVTVHFCCNAIIDTLSLRQ